MKKIILTAAAAVAAFAGVNAQTASDASSYTINVPQILSIATTPTNANFTHTLTSAQLTAGKTLQTVDWTVKSNGMWKASAEWSVVASNTSTGNSGLVTSSVSNFRNALKYSVDGTTWLSLPNAGGTANPIPGFNNMAPTPVAGSSLSIQAMLEPINFGVVPGTYTATTTVTVTAL